MGSIETVLAALNAAGVRYLVALADLIQLKRDARRPIDHADVEALLAIEQGQAQ